MNIIVSINLEQRLFVLDCGPGYSCLGFDVVERRSLHLMSWLNMQGYGCSPLTALAGTPEAYQRYEALCNVAQNVCESRHIRCDIELTPQLKGLEGKRVEVVDRYGDRRRFWVGRSTGWMPCHLEIARRNSSGGGSVSGAPFQSITIIS